MSAPSWLERPRYRERVVASKRGWIVERTGEVLVSVVNMDEKLRQYFGFDFLEVPASVDEEKKEVVVEPGDVKEIVETIDQIIETSQKDDTVEPTKEVSDIEKLIDEQPEPVKKRRGRPRKNKEESK